MNTQFHTPSFGDEVFDLGDASTSTPTSGMGTGNQINNMNNYNMYQQQQQQTPQSVTQTKRMISLHNTSDEYHTANEESFSAAANNSMNNSIIQQTSTPNNAVHGGNNGTSTTSTAPTTTMAARKQMLPLDQNEPAKPLSAYALFFRDTVSAIKQQNPLCSFQELSKIVASMWDALDPGHKSVYNKKNEMAKVEYLKQMRIYQQQQQQKQEQINLANSNVTINSTETIKPNTSPQQQQQITISQQQQAKNQQQQLPQNNPQLMRNNNLANTNAATSAPPNANTAAPSEDQMRLLTEAGSVQKCTRENCNKRAIINPDWEDEYCSNECVVIHCRNVFNSWVQSNLEAKQQPQQQTTTAT